MTEAPTDSIRTTSISRPLTSFSTLPPEIRSEIWKLVHRDLPARIVTLTYNPHHGYSSKTVPPPTIFINRESRHAALQIYTPAFTTHHPPPSPPALLNPPSTNHLFNQSYSLLPTAPFRAPIYIAFACDILTLQGLQGDAITTALEALDPSDRARIQHLAIHVDVDPWIPFREVLRAQWAAIAALPRLKCVYTMRVDPWLVWCALTEQEMARVLFGERGGETSGESRERWRESLAVMGDGVPRTGVGRQVPPGVHVGHGDLVRMRGVHWDRSCTCWMVKRFEAGRRHRWVVDEEGVALAWSENGFWISVVSPEREEWKEEWRDGGGFF